jgi:hypothetical protein
VLGDYLDRHSGADFGILWSQHSVEVRYAGQARIFTVQNLYDLGMIMYLKSSAHASKEGPSVTGPTGKGLEAILSKG